MLLHHFHHSTRYPEFPSVLLHVWLGEYLLPHTHHLCFSTISQIWHESHSKCSSLVWPPRPVKKPSFRLLPGPTLPATTHMYLLCCPHNPTWYLDFTHPSPRSSLVNIPAIFMHTFSVHTTHTFPTTCQI